LGFNGSYYNEESKTLKVLDKTGILFGLFFCAIVSANASTLDYSFTFTGTAFSGSGDIFVNSTKDSLGGYDITGISGSIKGPTFGAITGLDTQPGTPNATGLFTDPVTGKQWLYNDVLFTSGVPFDNNGVLFSFGSKGQYVANMYSIGTQLYLSLSQPGAYFDPGDSINLKVAETPLPAGLPLFLTALGGLWFVRSRAKKKGSDTRIELAQLGSTYAKK
jgi:hypothetical protein